VNTPERMARLFDGAAESFDGIYSGHKGAIGRAWDSWTRKNIQQRFDFTLEAIAPVAGKRILDVGCGPGRYCIECAKRGASKVVGLDVSPRMLDIGRDLATRAGVSDRCEFVIADILKYSADAPFDAAIAMGFFDYIIDQVTVMKHLKSMTKGRIIASFPCLWAWRVPVRKIWWKLKGWEIVLSTRQSILDVCEKSGVRVVELKRAGPLYLLVAEAEQ